MTAVLNEKTTSGRSIILQEGWRVFFMAAGIYALVALGVWLVWAGGLADLPFAPAPIAWHAHEMVFGFAFAAIAGFFLTAVPNWTGARPASARMITLLAGLWLAGRVAVWFAMVLPGWLVALVDLAFLPVLAATMLAQLLVRPKPQNLMFLGLLTLAWVANLLVHLDWMGLAGTEAQGIRGGLLTVCAMIAILGGRVTPAFTRNALLRVNPGAAVPVSRPRIDMAGIVLALLTALLATVNAPAALTGAVAVVAGLAALLRLSGWRPLDTLRDPIVWTMHASYLFLGLGLLGWGLSLLGLGSGSNAPKTSSGIAPSSAAMTDSTLENAKGAARSWSFSSSAARAGGTMSGRVLKICPSFTNVGPSSSSARRARSHLDSRYTPGRAGLRFRRGRARPAVCPSRSARNPNPYLAATRAISR